MNTLNHQLRGKQMIKLILRGDYKHPVHVMSATPWLHHGIRCLKPMLLAFYVLSIATGRTRR